MFFSAHGGNKSGGNDSGDCNKSCQRQRGFTLFELFIVACIVGVLATVLFNRVLLYQRMAEKTAMEETVGVLRGALHLKFAGLIAQHRENDAQYFVGQNPMNWLAEKPKNYVGELFGPEAGKVASGQWYFDLRDRSLVYLVHNRGSSDDGAKKASAAQIAFVIKVVWGNKSAEVGDAWMTHKVLEGVVLEQKFPYKWDQ
jgi:general secretion pathway protein G